MTYNNACSLGPQTELEAKQHNWKRMDCLAKYHLKNQRDNKKLMDWFKGQDSEWQASRLDRFTARANDRMRLYR